jgi:hypothetical protein
VHHDSYRPWCYHDGGRTAELCAMPCDDFEPKPAAKRTCETCRDWHENGCDTFADSSCERWGPKPAAYVSAGCAYPVGEPAASDCDLLGCKHTMLSGLVDSAGRQIEPASQELEGDVRCGKCGSDSYATPIHSVDGYAPRCAVCLVEEREEYLESASRLLAERDSLRAEAESLREKLRFAREDRIASVAAVTDACAEHHARDRAEIDELRRELEAESYRLAQSQRGNQRLSDENKAQAARIAKLEEALRQCAAGNCPDPRVGANRARAALSEGEGR